MLISSNELTALLKRVFEGMGYPIGYYEDAAALVKWLQVHGEQGFAELQRSLPYVADIQRPPLELLAEESQALLFDCHGRSGLNCLPTIVELAQTKVLEQGCVNVKVRNCHNRKFILKLLVDSARHGISVLAYWQNGKQPASEHVASIAAEASYPSYSEALLADSGTAADSQTLTLMFSTRIDLQGQLHGAGAKRSGYRQVIPEQFARAGEGALEGGMDISNELWQSLNHLAEAVLVENSEHSRSGAGGR
ncbi:DUF3726 domain-containing protein [Pseudomonas cavernicola]|uniref:DUF3726 domain-containing protein n=1 Tax=Pseudomonas cavernicola TaxID=2320866 RepID=A0A418X946_9PSED|nr:DUF3726 domain-containing protein [Pseudomonas cavernicola]RJG09006.1 DUF3726 domain-containing protein [Pseudomonas cavernicola]